MLRHQHRDLNLVGSVCLVVSLSQSPSSPASDSGSEDGSVSHKSETLVHSLDVSVSRSDEAAPLPLLSVSETAALTQTEEEEEQAIICAVRQTARGAAASDSGSEDADYDGSVSRHSDEAAPPPLPTVSETDSDKLESLLHDARGGFFDPLPHVVFDRSDRSRDFSDDFSVGDWSDHSRDFSDDLPVVDFDSDTDSVKLKSLFDPPPRVVLDFSGRSRDFSDDLPVGDWSDHSRGFSDDLPVNSETDSDIPDPPHVVLNYSGRSRYFHDVASAVGPPSREGSPIPDLMLSLSGMYHF